MTVTMSMASSDTQAVYDNDPQDRVDLSSNVLIYFWCCTRNPKLLGPASSLLSPDDKAHTSYGHVLAKCLQHYPEEPELAKSVAKPFIPSEPEQKLQMYCDLFSKLHVYVSIAKFPEICDDLLTPEVLSRSGLKVLGLINSRDPKVIEAATKPWSKDTTTTSAPAIEPFKTPTLQLCSATESFAAITPQSPPTPTSTPLLIEAPKLSTSSFEEHSLESLFKLLNLILEKLSSEEPRPKSMLQQPGPPPSPPPAFKRGPPPRLPPRRREHLFHNYDLYIENELHCLAGPFYLELNCDGRPCATVSSEIQMWVGLAPKKRSTLCAFGFFRLARDQLSIEVDQARKDSISRYVCEMQSKFKEWDKKFRDDFATQNIGVDRIVYAVMCRICTRYLGQQVLIKWNGVNFEGKILRVFYDDAEVLIEGIGSDGEMLSEWFNLYDFEVEVKVTVKDGDHEKLFALTD